MENPTILSPNNNGRRSSACNSPEFEFWMIRNPSCPETTLHSADELFSGGVLLPLQLLNTQNTDDPTDKDTTTEPTNVPPVSPNPDHIPGSDLRTTSTASKRWKDIFKKNPESKDKKRNNNKKERNGGSSCSSGGTSTAELNINLWPFPRSRSAGNGGSRPRTAVGNRKVSSAPCSRSNSTGESKYRKWPSSPSRGGVHLGRSSPVWQVRRFGDDHLVRSTGEKGTRQSKKSTPGEDTSKAVVGAGAKSKLMNHNAPTCVGYRKRLSCRGDEIKENSTVRVAGGNADVAEMSAGVGSGSEVGASSLFSLRSLFTKKVF